MKKIRNSFNQSKVLFANIFNFIDKYIIVPITKVAVIIKNYLTKDSKKIEKILNKKSSLLIISLIISVIVFIAVDTQSISMTETSAEVLYNQPVVVQYNEEAYVLEGVPATADITLIGRSSELYLAKQISSNEVTLDLSGLKPGVHKVMLKYTKALQTINYKLDPSSVSVTILPKLSKAKSISTDILNIDSLDPKLVISKTTIDRDEVIIKGSEATIAKVSTVKALVDINNLVDPKVGTLTLDNVPLIAYDQNGQVVNVEIVPSKVNATIVVASPQKTVPIKFIPTGELSFGKAIESITSNVNELTLYAPESVLADINYIEAELSVTGLKSNKEYNLTLKKPVGVKSMNESVANVKVVVGDEVSKEFSNINVQYENLGGSYTVNAKSATDRSITVIVKGVESVLNQLDPTTIKAYVDLKNYKEGEHEINVVVERTDLRLNYVPKIKKVTLVIASKN